MTRTISVCLLWSCLFCFGSLARADDLEDLQGWWVAQKYHPEGDFPVSLEIQKDVARLHCPNSDTYNMPFPFLPVFEIKFTLNTKATPKEFEFEPTLTAAAKAAFRPASPDEKPIPRGKGSYRLKKDELILTASSEEFRGSSIVFRRVAPDALEDLKKLSGYWRGELYWGGKKWSEGIATVLPGMAVLVVAEPPNNLHEFPRPARISHVQIRLEPAATPPRLHVTNLVTGKEGSNPEVVLSRLALSGVYDLQAEKFRCALMLASGVQPKTVDGKDLSESDRFNLCQVRWERFSLEAAQEWIAQKGIKPCDYQFNGFSLERVGVSAESLKGRWKMTARRDLSEKMDGDYAFALNNNAPAETWKFGAQRLTIDIAGQPKPSEFDYRLVEGMRFSPSDRDKLILSSPHDPNRVLCTLTIQSHQEKLRVVVHAGEHRWPVASESYRIYEFEQIAK